MADPNGFLKYERVDSGYRPVNVRIMDFDEVELMLPDQERKNQAGRCMSCSVPFCHWGCPVSNAIPEWQDALHQGDWKAAYDLLQDTNSFPEFTGRICPAPCESACVLAINDDAVTIRENELAIIERAFEEGYIKAQPPKVRSGKKVAVIGSGPAGLACANILNRLGHTVTLYEAADKVGGYLRFGVPDFKLHKGVIDRRVDIMQEEGLIIRTGVRVGFDISGEELKRENDAVCITIGARKARDLIVDGRNLDGVHFATDYLTQQNQINGGKVVALEDLITAKGKHVVVMGGGDTGSDCVGTANRQGALSITQIEIMPVPPHERPENEPWPLFPRLYKTSHSQEEGCERMFNILTKSFGGENGHVRSLSTVQVQWDKDQNGKPTMTEIEGSAIEMPADLVLLALGFEHVVQEGLVKDLGLTLSPRGNIAVDEQFMTNVPGIFAAGDSVRGASLIVWAIQEGQDAAQGIHRYLESV
jgi:glutamate synthase (NADPH/NADH) small chain